ncbi:MAG TPA: BatA domain-containing protein [Gemmatimonadaceae bacterium]|nr:BatA domain-containing protein [Gemmatimonadaceae bacterium]
MTLLAPGYFLASLAVAAAILGLHFIVVRQPRAGILPTARFIPDSQAKAIAAARRPSDIAVLVLRMLTIIAAGTALAKPVLTPSRRPTARVILADVSRSLKDTAALRDSVRAVYRDGDALVVFDSGARLVAGTGADRIGALSPSVRRGNLSGALIAALRAGSEVRSDADSLELVIVSPFAREELDAATDSIRKLWPGRARLVSIAAPTPDTAAARAAVAVIWPTTDRPRFAVQRSVVDTIGGVTVGERGVVAPFVRRWSYPVDSLRGAEVVGRWYDGEPAAVEKPDGGGCVRSVAIPTNPVGDLVIRSDWGRLVAELSRPCAAVTALLRADPGDIAKLAGAGALASRSAFEPATNRKSSIAPWLFALAIAAAVAELFLRRRKASADASSDVGGPARVPLPASRAKIA